MSDTTPDYAAWSRMATLIIEDAVGNELVDTLLLDLARDQDAAGLAHLLVEAIKTGGLALRAEIDASDGTPGPALRFLTSLAAKGHQ